MEIIQTRRLDNILFSSNGGYNLKERVWGLKIDIEGYEALAMSGASTLLFSNNLSSCVVWFEYQRSVTLQSGATEFSLFELLSRAGYSIYIVPGYSESQEKKVRKYTTRVLPPLWGSCFICDFEARLEDVDECKSEIFI
jgi:hypothetical protein